MGHPDPEIRGGPGLQKNVLWPFRPQFGIKISGGGGDLLDPSPGSAAADGLSHGCK